MTTENCKTTLKEELIKLVLPIISISTGGIGLNYTSTGDVYHIPFVCVLFFGAGALIQYLINFIIIVINNDIPSVLKESIDKLTPFGWFMKCFIWFAFAIVITSISSLLILAFTTAFNIQIQYFNVNMIAKICLGVSVIFTIIMYSWSLYDMKTNPINPIVMKK